MAFKRLPNNYGTIDRLPGSRRRPYRARKKIGEKDGKPVYATIGYYADKGEALRQLSIASDDVLVKEPGVTFNQCVDLWMKEYELTKPLADSVKASVRYLSPLMRRNIADLRAIDLEAVINTDKIPRTVKSKCITVLHGVFSYAVRHELTTKDYAKIAKYALDTAPKIKRKVYTEDEIDEMWKRYDIYDKITLIQLYTGMRISEVLEMKTANVHPEEGYMIGGNKTEAGKNRYIPIHPAIYMLIKEFYEKGYEFLITRKNKPVPSISVKKMLKSRDHTTHDARHTFATQAYKCGISEADIKRIMGHAQSGVTQATYIHPDNSYLSDEIIKLFY